MKITKELIESLDPCKDRYKNYLKYYGDEALTIAQFLGRKNLTQTDKLWVAFRLMPRDSVRLAAADIAESVLHIFEAQYPNDDRPRKAIAAARAVDVDKAREAASGADDAVYYASTSAAYFATNAAYFAAYAAYSTYAHAYTNAASAAYSAAKAAAASPYAVNDAFEAYKQEKLIRKIILKYWKE